VAVNRCYALALGIHRDQDASVDRPAAADHL